MSQFVVEIPDDALAALNLPRDAVQGEIRMAAAVKLYEIGKLSSGAAAHLAGVPRTVFLARLSEFDVDTFRLSVEELARETPLA